MAFTLDVIGLKEANRALKNLPKPVRKGVQQVEDETAEKLTGMAQSRAPFEEGDLKSGLSWQSRPRSLSAVVLVDREKAGHWLLQEFGTVHHGAKPFLRPSAQTMKPDHHRRLMDVLEKANQDMENQAK